MVYRFLFGFFVVVLSTSLTGCDGKKAKDHPQPVNTNTFTLKCQLLPQKIFSHTYVIEEGASRVSDDTNKHYAAIFSSEEIKWRENYPASAKSYGIYTINRSTGIEKITIFSTETDEKEIEEDYGCEKLEHKF